MAEEVDIKENELLADHPEVLRLLLLDQTTHENIFWATDSYAGLGAGYQWGSDHGRSHHGRAREHHSAPEREEP